MQIKTKKTNNNIEFRKRRTEIAKGEKVGLGFEGGREVCGERERELLSVIGESTEL